MKKILARITQYTKESKGINSEKRTKQFKEKVVNQNNPNFYVL